MKERSEDERRYLDLLLGRFLEELAEGRVIDLELEAANRPELRAGIEEVLSIASEIALARPAARPQIAGYEILSRIGAGGMGTVYLALERSQARHVALKMVTSRRAEYSLARPRFVREARAMARLNHRGIIPIYDVGADADTPYFTMEWVKGRSSAHVLSALRQTGKPAADLAAGDFEAAADCPSPESDYPRTCARIALEVAEALEHAHSQGVVHRDVKPSNIMIRSDGRAQLFDFGLARIALDSALTAEGAYVGTPQYSSPEQAAGGKVGAQSDVWSLGATLYELLTLTPPFTGPTPEAVLRRVRESEPTPPRACNPRVPPELESIVLRALSKHVAERHAGAVELAVELRRMVMDGGVS